MTPAGDLRHDAAVLRVKRILIGRDVGKHVARRRARRPRPCRRTTSRCRARARPKCWRPGGARLRIKQTTRRWALRIFGSGERICRLRGRRYGARRRQYAGLSEGRDRHQGVGRNRKVLLERSRCHAAVRRLDPVLGRPDRRRARQDRRSFSHSSRQSGVYSYWIDDGVAVSETVFVLNDSARTDRVAPLTAYVLVEIRNESHHKREFDSLFGALLRGDTAATCARCTTPARRVHCVERIGAASSPCDRAIGRTRRATT